MNPHRDGDQAPSAVREMHWRDLPAILPAWVQGLVDTAGGRTPTAVVAVVAWLAAPAELLAAWCARGRIALTTTDRAGLLLARHLEHPARNSLRGWLAAYVYVAGLTLAATALVKGVAAAFGTPPGMGAWVAVAASIAFVIAAGAWLADGGRRSRRALRLARRVPTPQIGSWAPHVGEWTVTVRRHARGRGIGSALVAAASAHTDRLPAALVAADAATARWYIDRHGFQPHPDNPQDAGPVVLVRSTNAHGSNPRSAGSPPRRRPGLPPG